MEVVAPNSAMTNHYTGTTGVEGMQKTERKYIHSQPYTDTYTYTTTTFTITQIHTQTRHIYSMTHDREQEKRHRAGRLHAGYLSQAKQSLLPEKKLQSLSCELVWVPRQQAMLT